MTAPAIDIWFSGPRVALPPSRPAALRRGFRHKDAHFRVRRLQIRRQAAPGQLFRCGRADRRDDRAREAAPDVLLQFLLFDDLPEVRKLHAGREQNHIDLAAGQAFAARRSGSTSSGNVH